MSTATQSLHFKADFANRQKLFLSPDQLHSGLNSVFSSVNYYINHSSKDFKISVLFNKK